MKKVSLSLMAVIIGVLVVSLISSAITGVSFITPTAGANVSGTGYIVNWTNINNLPLLSLQYKIGDCASANPWEDLSIGMPSSTTTYAWDVSTLNGIYCLKLYDSALNEELSGNVVIDNIDPIASTGAGEPYYCNEGDVINLDGSNSIDAETGIFSYEWELDGDGLYNDAVGAIVNYTCGDGPQEAPIHLKVTDYAGNTNTASSIVNISNVPPVCNGIIGFTDFAVGEPVTLTENATDVIDLLTFNWDFNDSTTYLGNPANHTFASAGVYNVSVVVSDGTASCGDSLEVTIVNPVILTDQEVMALQNLDANFTPNEGAVANSFATGLTGGVSCVKRITEPASMSIAGNANDCVVTWNAVENANSGVNPMVVRVDNGTDYEYYSFDTTVWSWKLYLTPGWNLISIPAVPEDTSIQNVLFNQLYDALPGGSEYPVWSYQDGAWLKSRRDNYGNLDTIEPGHAYWINLTNAEILYGYGDKLIAAQSPPETAFTAGWNLIGHYGLLTVTVADALSSLANYYNAVLDKDGNPVTSFVPGEGYWVSSNSNLHEGDVIQYTPSTQSYSFN